MLGVGLRQLCLQDSFGYAFQKKNSTKIDPRRVQNPPAVSPKWLVEGLRTAFLCKWAQLGRQGRSEAVFGRLWGRSWDAFGALGAVLGPSGPLLGASWGSFLAF